jgi:hypothetical protein
MACGLVTTGQGVRIDLGLVGRPTSFRVNGEYVKAVNYRVFGSCDCSFYKYVQCTLETFTSLLGLNGFLIVPR